MMEDPAARTWLADLPLEWGLDALYLLTYEIDPFRAGLDRAGLIAQRASLTDSEYRGSWEPIPRRASGAPGL